MNFSTAFVYFSDFAPCMCGRKWVQMYVGCNPLTPCLDKAESLYQLDPRPDPSRGNSHKEGRFQNIRFQ
jgi:hypothetical protein